MNKKCHLIYRTDDLVPYCKVHKVSMILMCPMKGDEEKGQGDMKLKECNKCGKKHSEQEFLKTTQKEEIIKQIKGLTVEVEKKVNPVVYNLSDKSVEYIMRIIENHLNTHVEIDSYSKGKENKEKNNG